MKTVSIVIVNWNTGSLLKKCIESLRALPEYSTIRHIVVIDNNSHDHSSKDLATIHDSKLALLQQQENLGFAKATNLGIRYIHEHEGSDDHILLLNPDTEVRPHAIAGMLDVLTKNKKAGIVGCKLVHLNGTLQKSVRTFPSLPVLVMLFLKLHRLFPRTSSWKTYMMNTFDYSKEQRVEQVMGAAFLIRNSLLEKIGLLDEAFWVWFEEVDYCKQSRDGGWHTIYTPYAEIMHHGGVSFNQLRGPRKTMPFLNSAVAYSKKHLGIASTTILTLLYPAAYIISILTLVAPKNKKNGNPLLAWAMITMLCALVIAIFINAQMGLALVGFAVIAWWAWEHPEEALLFFIVLSPLLPLLKVTQTLGNATLVKDVIIGTLFLKTFLVPLFSKTLPYRRNALLAPMIALAGWATMQSIHASSHVLAVLRLRDILLYMALYIGALYLPHTKKIMRTRFLWFIASLVAVMILGIIQLKFFPDSTVLRFDPVRQIWIPRAGSTFGHPAVFAEFLVTAEMLCIGYLLAGYTSIKKNIAIIALFISTLPLLYYTYTRASWIAFVIGLAMMTLLVIWKNTGGIKIQKKYIGVVGGMVIISVTGLLQFTHAGTFLRSAFDPTYASNADRLGFVTQLIAQTSNRDAILGKGLGSSITQTNNTQDVTAIDIASGDSRTIQLSQDATLVDNQYLKTFIEMGIVGLVFTVWLFWRFFAASLFLIRTNKSRINRLLGIAGIGFITAFVAQALFVDIWDIYPTNAIFWIFAALISQAQIPE